MAVYPTNLPPPLVEGYEVAPVSPAVRTEMESGAARVRRRTSAKNDKISLSWVFSNAEFIQFRTWFDTTINGGASWFNITLNSGASSSAVEARFSEIFKASSVSSNLHWKVSASLEIR